MQKGRSHNNPEIEKLVQKQDQTQQVRLTLQDAEGDEGLGKRGRQRKSRKLNRHRCVKKKESKLAKGTKNQKEKGLADERRPAKSYESCKRPKEVDRYMGWRNRCCAEAILHVEHVLIERVLPGPTSGIKILFRSPNA
jgi:hypothetical protein